jgi:hypothetical protein
VINGLVGARFQLGEKRFTAPVPAAEVPVFLQAVQLRGGAWTGRSCFETPKKCRSYKVELIESGPVFAKIAFEYRFDGFRGEGSDKQNFLVGDPGMEENQKLARIYGPRGGQGFLAVFYPRKANEPEPKIESLANGKLVRLTLPDQTHWILLSKEQVTASDGLVKLTGTAAVAKRWDDGKVEVTLLAKGRAECGQVTLESMTPATKRQ